METSINSKRVLVDVFTWYDNIDPVTHVLPTEGIYTHADALARWFTPAIMLGKDETLNPVILQKLEDFIGKGIEIFSDPKELRSTGYKNWISISVNAPTPRLPEMAGLITRHAVLHDAMAGSGLFGDTSVGDFEFGAEHHDFFLHVSNHAKDQFVTWQLWGGHPPCRPTQFIAYSGFHRIPRGYIEHSRESNRSGALGVGSLYKRKRVIANACLAHRKRLAYTHVGILKNDEAAAVFLGETKYCHWLGALSHDDLYLEYCSADAVISLSCNEGYSLPPLEAIVLGVPRLYLSSIPAHLENYSGAAEFFNTRHLADADSSNRATVSDELRDIFTIWYSAPEVLKRLETSLGLR